MSIVVEYAGFLTSIQDRGRKGYEKFGLTLAGAMDWKSMQIANILVDNDPNEAVLEITAVGPVLQFSTPAVIAVVGAEFRWKVNDITQRNNCAVIVHSGDVVRFGNLQKGCRAYLAVSGGFAVDEVMGSRSTLLRYGIGGYHGRKLEKDDVLEVREQSIRSLKNMEARVTTHKVPDEKCCTIRVILGPQEEYFTDKGLWDFLHGQYEIGKASDRMGYRLDGPEIQHKKDGNIISDGIVAGSIQIPTDGKPIILMADHQTVGGYTKIATVIAVDLPILAQRRVGEHVCFEAISVEEAQMLYYTWHFRCESLRKYLKDPQKNRDICPLRVCDYSAELIAE